MAYFEACAASVKGQTTTNWEWVIVDDGSDQPELHAVLDELRTDPRVSILTLDANSGISEATNTGVLAATGDFIAFLDQDDVLSADALEHVHRIIGEHPDVDFIYSDEDKVDDSGRHFSRFRKPSWSPERLRGQNYCSHLSVIRRALLESHGLLRSEFDGAQDHELLLRLAPHFRKVAHIPHVLYHWRVSPTSTSQNVDAKPAAATAALRAVGESLHRIGVEADLETNPAGYVSARSRHSIRWAPRVSVIIPTAGTVKRVLGRTSLLIADCLRSVARSTYADLEVVIVHDDLDELTLSELVEIDPRVRLVPYERPFNFSEKCNLGALCSTGEVLVFLNDDTVIISPDWLEIFIAFLSESDVGIVGPKLILEDGRIQSAGHWNEFGAHHVAPGFPSNFPGPFGCLTISSERSGLTFACAATTRSVFYSVGGLCEQLPRAFNDVDFGNKVRRAGMRLVWTPEVEVRHFESESRDPRTNEEEIRSIYRRWKSDLDGIDPFLPGFLFQITGRDFSDSLLRDTPEHSPHHSQLSNLGIW